MTEDKVVNPKSLENLIPFKKGDTNDKAKNGRLGGIKSGESKRRMKTFREELMAILSKETKNSKGETVSFQENINAAIILKAAKGDVRAYETIRDTLGQKPKDEKEVVVMAEGGLQVNLDLVKKMEESLDAGNK